MGYTLRPYQQKYLDNFEVGTSNLVRGECRMGKSLVLMAIIDRYFEGKKVLIIASRVEVIKELSKYYKEHTILMGNHKYDPTKDVTLASFQTLKRRDIDYSSYDLIAVDEAHEYFDTDTAVAIRKLSGKTTVMGMTATPLTNRNSYIGGYDKILDYTSVIQMIKEGYLTKTRFMSLYDISSHNKLSVRAGEYTSKSIDQAFDKSALEVRLKEDSEKYGWITDHKTLMFTNSIKSADKLCKAFNDKDVRVLHSKLTKEEHEDTMAWFRTTSNGMVISIRTLTTGYNEPTADRIVYLSPTMIRSLFMQSIFRASTIDSDNPNKEAIVYDYSGNLKKFSPFFEDWYAEPKPNCMEECLKLDDREEQFFCMEACTGQGLVGACREKSYEDYKNNPFFVDWVVMEGRPCGFIHPVHSFEYKTTQGALGTMHKWAKCSCGCVTRATFRTMVDPQELVEVYNEDDEYDPGVRDKHKVMVVYSKAEHKCLVIADNHNTETYKFSIVESQMDMYRFITKVLKSEPFSITSNIPLDKIPNTNVVDMPDEVVDLVEWDKGNKSQPFIRRLIKFHGAIAIKRFGYKKGMLYYFMKGVTPHNQKYVINTLTHKHLDTKMFTNLHRELDRGWV